MRSKTQPPLPTQPWPGDTSASRWSAVLIAFLNILWVEIAHAQIEWRVSVKFILDSNGHRPPLTLTNANGVVKTNALASDAQVRAQIDYGNQVLRRSGRGYQTVLTEIVDVPDASRWFRIDATGDGDDQDPTNDGLELERAVMQSFTNGPNKFRFAAAAINIYVLGSATQGACICSGRDADSDLIVVSQNINPDWVLLHESAHYLSLKHTHAGQEEGRNAPPCAERLPGDDGIADTLPDNSCWSWERLAQNNPTATLTELTNTFFNIMAKHGNAPGFRYLLTSDQLDAMTDASNTRRRHVASGTTVFVDVAAVSCNPTGQSDAPFRSLANAIDFASAHDTILMRRGRYSLPRLLTKPMTLRASRGDAVIHAP